MTPAGHRAAKRTVFEQWLQDFSTVSVIIDPKHTSGLPTCLQAEPQISLEYGLNMPIPIDDLKISEVGIDATLSFDRTPHAVFVPWDAVGAIYTSAGDIVVWPTDAPEDFVVPVPELATGTDGPSGLTEAEWTEIEGTSRVEAPKFPPLRLVTDNNRDEFEGNRDVIAYTGPPKLRLVN